MNQVRFPLILSAALLTGAGFAATQEVAGVKRDVAWQDGEFVCLEPGFRVEHERYMDPNTLAYVEGAELPASRDLQVASTFTGRYGKSTGDYAAHDLDLRLMRSLGEVMALRLELGFTHVDTGDALPRPAPERLGLHRIGLGVKALGRTPAEDGWATSAVMQMGINQLDPVTGQPAPGFYTGGYTAAEYRLTDKLTYVANFGYDLNTADHILTDGRIDHTLYFNLHLSHGFAYRVTRQFSLGVENRMSTDFVDFERFDATAIYLGPSCHYAAGHTTATLAIFPQLRGKPNHSGRRDLVAHEKLEVRLQLTCAF